MKRKKIFLRFFKRIKLRTLFFLAILLASNTFSWFIYTTKVSNNMTAHVKSWKVDFEIAGGEREEEIVFKVDSAYPGMEVITNEITATNNGESPASIRFEVIEAHIMGDDLFLDPSSNSTSVLNMLTTSYPFKINLSVDKQTIDPLGGSGKFLVSFSWPYESGNDEEDTYWGRRAYTFHEDYPDEASISLKIRISASQIVEE